MVFKLLLRIFIATAIAVTTPLSYAQTEPSGTWLDNTKNWNQPDASIPQAQSNEDGNNLSSCSRIARQAKLPEDKLVEAAGWTLTGAVQMYEGIIIITAMVDADGMCRPLNYQVFVFKDSKFAGTLSPIPMYSRTDGNLIRYELYQEGQIDATFSRYTADDALCCASRISRLFYKIKTQDNHPVLVPNLPADTSPN